MNYQQPEIEEIDNSQPKTIRDKKHMSYPQDQSSKVLYRIEEKEYFEINQHAYKGHLHDLADGFIHLSTPQQVNQTLEIHYKNKKDIILIALDLKYEPSRGGELFPHYFGTLPLDSILWIKDITHDKEGKAHLPPLEESIQHDAFFAHTLAPPLHADGA
jgi:uncharacterized protein (DUF952 family)